MANAGLLFADPYLARSNVGLSINPYAPFSPTSSIGLGGLGPSAADAQVTGRAVAPQNQFGIPRMRSPVGIAISPSRNELYVQGVTFSVDDARSALESESLLSSPGVGLPTEGDWVPIPESAYRQYLESIRSPGLGTLAAKSFGMGVDNLQMLYGRGLQFLGAEKLGGRIVAQQEQDLSYNAPYQRNFTDIESGGDAVEWFVGNFAQQGPNLIESIAAAGLGFLGGMAIGGPIAGAGGALAGLLRKEAFKQGVNAAARKRLAGEALNEAENKLLKEAAGIAGAVAATATQALAQGTADIYGELREQGADAGDVSARITALAGGIPYASLSLLPGYVLTSRVFGGALSPTTPAAGIGDYLKRGAVGLGVGGLTEGATETGQEALVLGLSGQDLTSPEGTDRLINAFAAGFGVGGPLGAAANLLPQNILKPEAPTSPTEVRDKLDRDKQTLNKALNYEEASLAFSVLDKSSLSPQQVAELQSIVDSKPRVNLTQKIESISGAKDPASLFTAGSNINRSQLSAQQSIALDAAIKEKADSLFPSFINTLRTQEYDDSISALPQLLDKANVFSSNQLADIKQVLADRFLGLEKIRDSLAIDKELLEDYADGSLQGLSQLIGGMKATTKDLSPFEVQVFNDQLIDLVISTRENKDPVDTSLLLRNSFPERSPAELNNRIISRVDETEREEIDYGVNYLLGRLDAAQTIEDAQRIYDALIRDNRSLSAADRQQLTDKLLSFEPSAYPDTPAPRAGLTLPIQDFSTKPRTVLVDQVVPTNLDYSGPQQGELNLFFPPTEPEAEQFYGRREPSPFGIGSLGDVFQRAQRNQQFDLAEQQRAPEEQRQRDVEFALAEQQKVLQDTALERAGLSPATFPAPSERAAPEPVSRLPSLTVEEEVQGFELVGKKDGYKNPVLAGDAKRRRRDDSIRILRKNKKSNFYLYKPTYEIVGKPEGYKTKNAATIVLGRKKDPAIEVFEFENRFYLRKPLTPPPGGTTPPGGGPGTSGGSGGTPSPSGAAGASLYRGKGARAATAAQTAVTPPAAAQTAVTPAAQAAAQATVTPPVQTPPAAAQTAVTPAAQAAVTPAAVTPPAAQAAQTPPAATQTAVTPPAAAQTVVEPEPEAAVTPAAQAAVTPAAQAAVAPGAASLRKKRTAKSTPTKGVTPPAAAVEPTVTPTPEPETGVNALKKEFEDVKAKIQEANDVLTDFNNKHLAIEDATYEENEARAALQQNLDTAKQGLVDLADSIINDTIDRAAFSEKESKDLSKLIGNLSRRLEKINRERAAELETIKVEIDAGTFQETVIGEDSEVSRRSIYLAETETAPTAELDTETTEPAKAKRERKPKPKTTESKTESVSKGWGLSTLISDAKKSGKTFIIDAMPEKSIGRGKLNMLVRGILSKYSNKPRMIVVDNLEAFKSKFPNEYRKAKEQYTQGDFDDVLAAGYSYRDGDKGVTVLFADMIPTEQVARFVTAHENVGHFGFRSIVSDEQLDKVLNAIYERDYKVRRLADEQATAQNIDRLEATEEVLSDMAAALDTSTVLRLWAGVKTALENLTGAKFDDYMARHFIQQSRAYVRNGNVGGRLVDLIAIAESIQYSNSAPSQSIGRFMRSTTDLYRQNQMAGIYNLTRNMFSPQSIGDVTKSLKDFGLNTKEGFDRFKKNFFGLAIFTMGENEGSAAGLAAIQAGSDKASSIKEYVNELLKDYLNVGLFNTNFLGIKQDTYDSINSLIYASNAKFGEEYDPTKLPKLKDVVTVNVDAAGKATVSINKKIVDKLFEESTISIKDVRDGFTWDVQVGDDPTNIVTNRFEGIADITGKTDPRYQGYIKARQTIRYIWEQLVIAKFEALEYNRVISYEEIAQVMRNKELKEEQRKFIKDIYDKFLEIYNSDMTYDETSKQYTINPDSIERAEKFAADANKVIIIENTNTPEYTQNVKDFIDALQPKTPEKADAIRKKLEAFRGEFERPQGKDNPDLFTIQNTIRKLGYEELSARDSDVNTFLQSIATSYAPLVRRGDVQARVLAYDENGKIVKLQDDYANMLAYRQFESLSEAKNFAEWFENTVFKEDDKYVYYDVKAIDPQTHTAVSKKVRFEVVVEDVQTENSAPPQLNLNEFQRGLRHFNIILPPKKMREVIIGLTRQDASARKRLLRRANVPGASTDALRAISELADSMGATIGKVTARPRLSELMNLKSRRIQDMWNGDKDRLENLKVEWERVKNDPTASWQRKELAKRTYYRYKFWYTNTNPEKNVSRANDYRNRLGNLISFMDNARQFDQTNLEANKYISMLRTITSIVQLGGSIATGTLNYVGMAINGPAYLATYNEQTNTGGGFGAGKSVMAIHKALSDIGMVRAILEPNLNRADFYFRMLDKNEHSKGAAAKLRSKYNLTEAEAEFIGTEILEGRMIPAQMNSVMNTSRGQFLNLPGLAKFIDLYMKPFALTEQGSRRGLGLAAFRLEYDRSLIAFKELGRSDEEAAKLAAQRAKEFAVEALDKTLGQYSITSRPPFFTGGVFSLLYMYKVFPTTTIQLLSRLDRPGQMAMVLSLFLLSGLAGMPFAEDIEDVLDTIMQQVGRMTNTPWRGVRIELAEEMDKILPGISPYAIRGLVNSFSTVDVASRTSVGNFVPGTSFPLAGSDAKQELLELGGPMAGMLAGLARTIPNAVRAATGDPRVSLVDVFRESPVTMMRAFGDAFAYTSSGAIVDRRGYVLEPEVTTAAIVGRMMGWYPTAAAEQYEVVRYSQRMLNFQKEIALSYRLAWVKASINNDRSSMRAIEDAVRDWNEGARGTGMEIRNFLVGARRALREAERPGVERYMRTTPRHARQDLDYVEGLLSY